MTKAPRKTKRTAKKAVPRPDWAIRFLAEFAKHGVVSHAAIKANIGRNAIYERRKLDEEFARAMDAAEEDAADELEMEAVRRGKEGTVRAIYHGTRIIGYERVMSDTLLIFMLKARRPAKFRETHKVLHAGHDGGPIPKPEPVGPADLMARLAEYTAAFVARAGGQVASAPPSDGAGQQVDSVAANSPTG